MARTSIVLACTLFLVANQAVTCATTILTEYPHVTAVLRDEDSALTLPWSMILPPSHGTATEELPLVVFLHGSGERGRDGRNPINFHTELIANATQRENDVRLGCGTDQAFGGASCGLLAHEMDNQYESYFLAPQVSRNASWFTYRDMTATLIEEIVEEYNVDPQRIYLTGFSMGAFGTFSMLSEYPDLFAAAVPLAGGGNPFTVDSYVDVPMWIFHGAVDDIVDAHASIEMEQALLAAGGSPRLTILPGIGHDLPKEVYIDSQQTFYPWLFSQVLVPEPASLGLGLLAAGCLACRSRMMR